MVFDGGNYTTIRFPDGGTCTGGHTVGGWLTPDGRRKEFGGTGWFNCTDGRSGRFRIRASGIPFGSLFIVGIEGSGEATVSGRSFRLSVH
jgi:hypothetical protein